KLDQMTSEFQALKETLADMASRMSRMQTQLVDLSNTVKVLSAPPAPPAAVVPNGGGASITAPPAGMSASDVYTHAQSDRTSGNLDLAMQGFQTYLQYYGNTDLAPNAQFYIGQI